MVVSSCVVLQRLVAAAFYRAWKRNLGFRFFGIYAKKSPEANIFHFNRKISFHF